MIADRTEIDRFVRALFPYADGVVSLRAFDQFDHKRPPFLIHPVEVNGSLEPLIDSAAAAATHCATAERAIVFAPPICTFTSAHRARGVDLSGGICLSVELDEGDTQKARERLERLLGPATVIVASGGEWTHPSTGEIFPKLHLHWRLSEPTTTPDDHAKLRDARGMAARLVGADPTGKPVVHPLRWPGSWNLKSKPCLARIVVENERAEINLDEALEALTEAAEAAGLDQAGVRPQGDPEAAIDMLASAMDWIPNAKHDVHYNDWIRLGYALYRACGGDEGFDLWDEWSRKSGKYDARETEAAWKRIVDAIDKSKAYRKIGAGTVFWLAGQAGWVRPNPTNTNPKGDPVDELIEEFNRQFAVVNDGGKVFVFRKTCDQILHRHHFQRISFNDFRRYI
jgi:Primase C terminal 2 (PriCT-2)